MAFVHGHVLVLHTARRPKDPSGGTQGPCEGHLRATQHPAGPHQGHTAGVNGTGRVYDSMAAIWTRRCVHCAPAVRPVQGVPAQGGPLAPRSRVCGPCRGACVIHADAAATRWRHTCGALCCAWVSVHPCTFMPVRRSVLQRSMPHVPVFHTAKHVVSVRDIHQEAAARHLPRSGRRLHMRSKANHTRCTVEDCM
eukprot:362783-Chlamydomonas_euryale.AAC.13